MSITEYISIPAFVFSFAFGIFSVYMMNPNKETIYVYPSPDNVKKIQYKDRADNCFEYVPHEVTCHQNEENYPFQ